MLCSIPGVIEYENANIQLLDLPGIIEGAAQGKGRGRQVKKYAVLFFIKNEILLVKRGILFLSD